MYPYRTSYEEVEDLSDQAIQYKEKLDQMLELNEVENSIIKNLAFVSVPHIASKDLLKAVTNFKDWHPKNFRAMIQEEFHNVYTKQTPHHGNFLQKFVKEFGAKFERKATFHKHFIFKLS